jgi:hypothetical protein
MSQRQDELVDLARTCAKNARLAASEELATRWWRSALEYQAKAKKIGDSGKPVEIGQPPYLLLLRVWRGRGDAAAVS